MKLKLVMKLFYYCNQSSIMKIFNPRILLRLLAVIFVLLFYFLKSNSQIISNYWIITLVGIIISYVIYDSFNFLKDKFKK